MLIMANSQSQNMIQGAETTLYAALSPELNGLTGLYLEDCAIRSPSVASQDVEDQNRLWDITRGLLSKWITGVLLEEEN